MLYFAYGSNMSVLRLHARVSSANPLDTAMLTGHSLQFHKVGKDASGKCDAHETGVFSDKVIGIIYELDDRDKSLLDGIEGLGCGYDEKEVTIVASDGQQLKAMVYVATHIDPSLKPYHWYKEHVLRGAKEHNLPPDYIQAIDAIQSVPDPDGDRHNHEISIYLQGKTIDECYLET